MDTTVIMDVVKITHESEVAYQCNINVASLSHKERNAIGTAITNEVIKQANTGDLAGLNMVLDAAAATIASTPSYQAVLSEFTRLVEMNHQLFYNNGKETGNNQH